ncbi:EAL domain-containing protein [Lactiplantibacillus nangangensis]|uniref:EAL domain-containing protein n=1 Tax=Lactiplantibacillus nangangensis TaxID=2559917 RepID=A0ABW1SIJ7_9LACO|nr:EAL domain-containing protein [Lactiplantibacillus nangangensis]
MQPVYRFFVQPQIDTQTKMISGFELLIRQKTAQGWRLPASFDDIDPEIFAKLLLVTTKVLAPKVEQCSVNISRQQLMTTTVADALVKCQEQLYPTKLVVELTEDESTQTYCTGSVLKHIKTFLQRGMEVSLDDVGSGENYFTEIRDLLPYASEIKFALQNFKQDFQTPEMQRRVHFWRAISAEYGLRLVLEGIETKDDNRLSKEIGIEVKQGYYFGKPRLLTLPHDSEKLLAH